MFYAQNSLYFDVNSSAQQQQFLWPLDATGPVQPNIFCEQQLDHEITFKQGALGQPRLIQAWHWR